MILSSTIGTVNVSRNPRDNSVYSGRGAHTNYLSADLKSTHTIVLISLCTSYRNYFFNNLNYIFVGCIIILKRLTCNMMGILNKNKADAKYDYTRMENKTVEVNNTNSTALKVENLSKTKDAYLH